MIEQEVLAVVADDVICAEDANFNVAVVWTEFCDSDGVDDTAF